MRKSCLCYFQVAQQLFISNYFQARMLEDLDIEALHLHKKDGKNFVPGS